MASSPNFDGVTRVLDLIATPLALEVLDGLGRGFRLRDIPPPGTRTEAVEAALEHLRGIGLVAMVTGSPSEQHPVLTPLGWRLLEALDQVSEFDQSDGTSQPGPDVR